MRSRKKNPTLAPTRRADVLAVDHRTSRHAEELGVEDPHVVADVSVERATDQRERAETGTLGRPAAADLRDDDPVRVDRDQEIARHPLELAVELGQAVGEAGAHRGVDRRLGAAAGRLAQRRADRAVGSERGDRVDPRARIELQDRLELEAIAPEAIADRLLGALVDHTDRDHREREAGDRSDHEEEVPDAGEDHREVDPFTALRAAVLQAAVLPAAFEAAMRPRPRPRSG
jgi:hypothetical protein